MFNRSVNKVVLVGNVGKTVETRHTASGSVVSHFSIATSESFKNKGTGEYENKSEWHNIVVFGKFAEMVATYVKKGAKIYVEGKLQTNKWVPEDGVARYKTEIVASDIQLLDPSQGANASQGSNAPQQGYQQPPQQQAPQRGFQQAPQQAPQQGYQQAPQQPQGTGTAYQKPLPTPQSHVAPTHREQANKPAYQPTAQPQPSYKGE